MAATATTVRQLLRNDDVSGTASCSMTTMSTGNTYYIPFGGAGEIVFQIQVNACDTSTDKSYCIMVSSGDAETALPLTYFSIWTTSCGNHNYLFGPVASAGYGNLSTSTSYGEEINGEYLIVSLINTTSSGASPDSTAAGGDIGEVHIEGIRWPQVAYST